MASALNLFMSAGFKKNRRYGKHASPTDEIVVFLRREKQG